MVRYSGTVIVPFARARVWSKMADWSNLKEWDINITRSDRVADQPKPDRVGTKFSCTFKANGIQSDVDYTCVKYDAEKMEIAQFEGFTNIFRSRDTVSFADVEGKPDHTAVTAEFNLDLRGPLFPLSFLLGGAMKKTGPVVMDKIESWLQEELGGQ